MLRLNVKLLKLYTLILFNSQVTINQKILLTPECSVTNWKCPEKHKVWPPKEDECIHKSIHTKMTNHTFKTAVTDDNFQNKLKLFSLYITEISLLV